MAHKAPVQVPAAGGVIFRIKNRKPEVLLIFRRDVWDLPKGKVDDGESFEMAAVREAAEETGSSLPLVAGRLPVTRHSYTMGDVEYVKHTHWFVMISRSERFTPQLDEQIEKVEWMPLDDALNLVGYENLKTVLNGFKTWLNKNANCQLLIIT